jgi:5-methylcytosine-specific restriction endonuclease McrA
MSARRVLIVALLGALLALPASAYAAFQYPEAPAYAPNPSAGQGAAQTPSASGTSHGLVAPTYIPKGVVNGVYATPMTPGSQSTTGTYALDWTIGVAGKSGCLVCHGDTNLVRIISGRVVSMHMDTMVLQRSAHANNLCTSCHTDFAQKQSHPNPDSAGTWREVAKNSCKNCHLQEYSEWAASAHSAAGSIGSTSTVGAPGSSAPGKPRPVCGDCHKAHSIPAKKDDQGHAEVQASALTMCGRCHTQASAEYNDYYHGAAYRSGAPDAPACWQCHGTHLVLASDNRQSSANPDNLVRTCSRCHKGAGEGYVGYAALVHSQHAAYEQNPVFSALSTASSAVGGVFNSVLSALRIRGS